MTFLVMSFSLSKALLLRLVGKKYIRRDGTGIREKNPGVNDEYVCVCNVYVYVYIVYMYIYNVYADRYTHYSHIEIYTQIYRNTEVISLIYSENSIIWDL